MYKKIFLLIILNFNINCLKNNSNISPVNPINFPILKWMQELEPLRKVHYSWPIPPKILENLNNPIFYEYVRLSNAASITARWATNTHVENVVQICKKVNLTNPLIPASIGLNYSPYHNAYTNNDTSPLGLDDKYQKELKIANTRFSLMKKLLANANAKYNTNIKVTAVILDSERFRYKSDADPLSLEWNTAITDKYKAIQTIIENYFPNIRIEWYGRGQIYPCSSTTGWCKNTHHPSDISSPGYSCNTPLYKVGNYRLMQEQFKRTVENGLTHGITIVNPWVALGAGYQDFDSTTSPREVREKFSLNWDYEHVYSWKLGAEINNSWYGNRPDRFAPWNACQIVIFYPEPFGRTNDWGRHFISYVRGSHTIKLLP